MTLQGLLLHPLVFCAGALLLLWAALELGRMLGRRHVASGGLSGGAIDAAVFALLGLLIAFTFSGAASRFDHRRDLIVQEANAIGTAWLRLDLAPPQTQPELRAVFRRYVDSRTAAYKVVADDDAFRAALGRSALLQKRLWGLAVVAGGRPDAAPGTNVLLLPALNDMIDITSTRALATQMHPPTVIYLMLFVLTLLGALLAGFGMGASAEPDGRSWLHMFAFAATMAITITIIVDMEYPRLGLIRVDAFEHEAFALGSPR